MHFKTDEEGCLLHTFLSVCVLRRYIHSFDKQRFLCYPVHDPFSSSSVPLSPNFLFCLSSLPLLFHSLAHLFLSRNFLSFFLSVTAAMLTQEYSPAAAARVHPPPSSSAVTGYSTLDKIDAEASSILISLANHETTRVHGNKVNTCISQQCWADLVS